MKSSQVVFRDWKTGEVINRWMTDWRFEEGQVYKGFWGAESTVMLVELGMEIEHIYPDKQKLIVIQVVWVQRKFYEI